MTNAAGKTQQALEWTVLLLLIVAVLWHGGKTLESTWLLGILASGITLSAWRRGDSGDTPAVLWALVMAYVLWVAGSFATSSAQNYGLDDVIRAASLALFFLWTARRRTGLRTLAFREKVSITLTVAVVFACLAGFLVYTLQPATRFVGTFFDQRFVTDYWPNAWADMLLLAWPLAWFVLKPLRKHWQLLVLALMIGCLFLSYSRGAFLSLLAQVVLFAFLGAGPFLRRPPELLRRGARHAAGALAVVTLAMLLFLAGNRLRSAYQPVESLAAKATFTADEGNSSVNERRDFWTQAIALSLERPLAGWGPYSFRFVQPRLQKGVFQTSDHPHNVFLKLAMESGWPAAVLFAFLLLLIVAPHLWAALRSWFGRGAGLGRFEVAAITSVGGLLLHNQIDYNLQFVGVALPLWLLLGFLVRPVPPQTHVSRRMFEAALSLVLLLILFIEGGFLVTSSLGRRAEARGDAGAALLWYGRSSRELFSRDMHLSRASLLLSNDDLAGALASLDRYQEQNREDARGWQMRGDVLLRKGDRIGALAAYEQAFAYGKYNYIGVLTAIVRIHREQGDSPALAARHDEFLAVYDAFAAAILQNAHFIALSQNVEEFQTAGRELGNAYPADRESISALSARAAAHAGIVRNQFKGRPKGVLW